MAKTACRVLTAAVAVGFLIATLGAVPVQDKPVLHTIDADTVAACNYLGFACLDKINDLEARWRQAAADAKSAQVAADTQALSAKDQADVLALIAAKKAAQK